MSFEKYIWIEKVFGCPMVQWRQLWSFGDLNLDRISCERVFGELSLLVNVAGVVRTF